MCKRDRGEQRVTLDRFGVENWMAGPDTTGAVDVEDWREIKLVTWCWLQLGWAEQF
jgi:hypothetical protein